MTIEGEAEGRPREEQGYREFALTGAAEGY